MGWQIESRKIYWVSCRQCGRQLLDWWGWSPHEAVAIALELGWAEGICEDCLAAQEALRKVSTENR